MPCDLAKQHLGVEVNENIVIIIIQEKITKVIRLCRMGDGESTRW